ncbi:MAG: immunity 17 family protein [Tannerellaceae bacterium]|jgi:small neutral amino acid transporter SnatA (MarC family)|nr:immunity 17 family protein [Tannerellaceae bacterium]
MGTAEYLVLSIFILTGSTSLIAAVFNFDWYFQSRKASSIVHWLGREGARIFYGLLGLALIAAGVLFFVHGYR